MSEPTVLITGASRGVGWALAQDLAKDHRVIGVARGDIPERGDADCRIDHRPGLDLGDPRSVESLAELLGACDALVNNVGMARDGILATQSMHDIERMLAVNLHSVIHLTKLYVRERLAVRRPGTIVNVSSIVANRGYRGLAVYSATKAALNAMTRSLAREMGAKGFRVNSVLPGFIETDMSGSLDAARREQIIRRTALGRLGQVDDVVPVVRFLLSDGARFITGQEIVVDGGQSL